MGRFEERGKMMHESAVYVFSFVFPWLVVTWIAAFVVRLGTWRLRAAIPLLSAAVVMIPVHGVPLARWLHAFNANFSLPFIVLVALDSYRRLAGKQIIERRELATAVAFGLVCGLLLYPMSVGLTDFDPYSLGWHPVLLLTVTLVAIASMLATRNRFAIWLIAVLAAFNLRLLESPNYWDYLVDPVYFVVSIVVGCRLLVVRLHQQLTTNN